MRVSIQVDKALLTKAIEMAEASGPLPNFSKLWNRAADIYNSMKPPVPITFSVIMLRVKEWNIPTKTIAGRKGGGIGSPVSSKAKASIATFIPISDYFKSTVEKGAMIGHESSLRWVIALDNYNWILAQEKEDGTLNAYRKFYPNFKLLFPAIKYYTGMSSKDYVNNLITKLNEIKKKDFKVSELTDDKEIGKMIDMNFNVNFFLNRNIGIELAGVGEDIGKDD